MTKHDGLSSVAECRAVSTEPSVALVIGLLGELPIIKAYVHITLVSFDTADTGTLTELQHFTVPHLQSPAQSQSAAAGPNAAPLSQLWNKKV